jgi:hypothetical protein
MVAERPGDLSLVEILSHSAIELADNADWIIKLIPPIACEHGANTFTAKPFLRVPKRYGARLIEARNLFSVESDRRSSEVRVKLQASVRPEDGNDSFGAHPCDRDFR